MGVGLEPKENDLFLPIFAPTGELRSGPTHTFGGCHPKGSSTQRRKDSGRFSVCFLFFGRKTQ